MNIQQVDDGKHGVFKLLDNDSLAGEMAYTWSSIIRCFDYFCSGAWGKSDPIMSFCKVCI
jgi:hypothetical protein